MKKIIICNRIQTPDGTILYSKHRHDFICHEDANGCRYCIDGGIVYQKLSYPPSHPPKDVSIYSTDDFEIIRTTFERGTLNKWIKLSDMTDEHVRNTIIYLKNLYEDVTSKDWIEIYQKEIEYRLEKNITL